MATVALAYPLADEPDPYAAPPPKYEPTPYKPAPVQYKPAPPQYKPAPAQYKPAPYKPKSPYKEEELPPQPYQFEYGVSDQYTGTNFKAAETQDDSGTVLGEYKVNLPDGRVQTVTYKVRRNFINRLTFFDINTFLN